MSDSVLEIMVLNFIPKYVSIKERLVFFSYLCISNFKLSEDAIAIEPCDIYLYGVWIIIGELENTVVTFRPFLFHSVGEERRIVGKKFLVDMEVDRLIYPTRRMIVSLGASVEGLRRLINTSEYLGVSCSGETVLGIVFRL